MARTRVATLSADLIVRTTQTATPIADPIVRTTQTATSSAAQAVGATMMTATITNLIAASTIAGQNRIAAGTLVILVVTTWDDTKAARKDSSLVIASLT